MAVVVAILALVIPASVWVLRLTIMGVTNWRGSLGNTAKIRTVTRALSSDMHAARNARTENSGRELYVNMHGGRQVVYRYRSGELRREVRLAGEESSPLQTVARGLTGVLFSVRGRGKQVLLCDIGAKTGDKKMPCRLVLVAGGEPWK